MKAILALSLALATVASAQPGNSRPGAGGGGPPPGRPPNHGPVHGGGGGYYHGGYIYRHGPPVYVGLGPVYYPAYGYYGGYGAGYPYYGAGYPYYGPTGYYGSGSAAASGFWLGALAGGIIGNNSRSFHHDSVAGAVWGAGVGWMLGSVVDANRRTAAYAAGPVAGSPPAQNGPAPTQPAAPAAAPQQAATVTNRPNSSTPMSGANNLFGR